MNLYARQVAIIVASPTPAALAAKAATKTIPILFGVTDDPVKLGLVASLARPGGNATGVNFYLAEFGLSAKRLGLLRELVPQATRIAALVNPKNAENAEAVTRDVTAAGSAIGTQIEVVHASEKQEIEAAFVTFVRNRVEALLVGTDPFFSVGGSNLPRWQRAMRSPPYTPYASIRNESEGGVSAARCLCRSHPQRGEAK
jgi:putative tryptophan/tyrosine transport system substrate-binding protein